jgi:hypothetical protein
MSRHLFWFFPLGALLFLGVLGGMAPSRDAPAQPPRADAVAADTPPASTEPYTFPSVVHTPAETAKARLLCAEMGEQGWAIAYRRERTGLTLEEALALLDKEHWGTPAFRPLERVTYLAYLNPLDNSWAAPDKVRGFVQRVCLRDMLGSLAEPKVEPPAATTTPAKKRGTTK